MTATFVLEDHPNPGQALTITYKEVTKFTGRVTIERLTEGESDGGIVLSLTEAEWVEGIFDRMGIDSRRHL